MSNVVDYLWLIPALPLAASALIAFLGPRFIRHLSHWPCVLAIAGSCVLSVMVLMAVIQAPGEPEAVKRYYTWFTVSDVNVGFTLRADALTAIMLVTVTFISTLIALYSSGYMHGDPGYPRYFAEIALFVFSMTGLVLADNFIVLYAFWEGVGLCSYLLVGFWFQKPAAAAAARKAFLVTRIGDMGFILGIILLWIMFGYRLDYDAVFGRAANVSESWLTIICLLLFCGAVGKSAQFPLHVWLPDAMEGPSPVSALIHAATMVTAGVYMVARCMPLFALVPSVLLVVAFIGAFTAMLAALIALTQNDLKRVLAYSTISQLGYMFLALGSGVSKDLVTVAVVAAVFHLFTHAFFKALLFLSAGSVMHAMGNVIDMRRFSGLRAILPITHWTFLCGALALSGFPLASGFWSKDEILGAAFDAGHESRLYSTAYYTFFVMGLVTAGLTAFYTFRGYFRTFWGELRVPEEAGHHAHESPSVMTIPLIILAAAALFIGIVVEPLTHWFSGLLTRTPLVGSLYSHHLDWTMMTVSSVFAVGGILIAYLMYVKQPELPGKLVQHSRELYELSLNKFRFDEFYNALIVQPLASAARICRVVDQYLIDGLVDLLGNLPRMFGQLFLPMQNGLVQFYALAMVFGLVVFLVTLTRILTANP